MRAGVMFKNLCDLTEANNLLKDIKSILDSAGVQGADDGTHICNRVKILVEQKKAAVHCAKEMERVYKELRKDIDTFLEGN